MQEQDIPPEGKDRRSHRAPPTVKKEAQHLVSLFRFGRQHVTCLGILLQPTYEIKQKAADWRQPRLWYKDP